MAPVKEFHFEVQGQGFGDRQLGFLKKISRAIMNLEGLLIIRKVFSNQDFNKEITGVTVLCHKNLSASFFPCIFYISPVQALYNPALSTHLEDSNSPPLFPLYSHAQYECISDEKRLLLT